MHSLRAPSERASGVAPPGPALAEARIQHRYLYEVLLYRAAEDKTPRLVRSAVLDTASRAIRALRLDLRAGHVFAMTPQESRRAVQWADEGFISARALLGLGESVGFTLRLHTGEIAEWTVRPAMFLCLTSTDWCDPKHQRGDAEPDLMAFP
ncbi:hypothetical protein [Streptomyces sp. WM6378]|uniref:hypothetical protein n=1 Tax=Streptomyces sp. WM6378 TaxID=1415557 RepID=UPI000A666897|nr:hypothetical protein [Streptomyces sp. WM6378]